MEVTTEQLFRINDVLTELVDELGVTFIDHYASIDSFQDSQEDIRDSWVDDMTHRIADQLASHTRKAGTT